jgi:hypothetical protein
MRPPRWLSLTVCALAVIGGLATLVLGLMLLAVRLTPDTGHGEDIGGFIVFAVAVPYLAISAFLGVGTGIGGFALSTGRSRLVPAVGILSTVVGIALAIVPIRT